jgi:hypothetical protein
MEEDEEVKKCGNVKFGQRERLLHKACMTSQHNRKNVNENSLHHTEYWGNKWKLSVLNGKMTE